MGMRTRYPLLWRVTVLALLTVSAIAQNQPVLKEDAVKVSEHVSAIMGWPNIAIVVGSSATLVVDTGLGPANGATIARVVAKLAPGNRKLYLTTTHFHPEHASGEAGFPSGTILIRDAVQQREMELHGREMVDMFASRSPQQKELLANATLRPADITFDSESRIDLGGVTARLLWFGGAHTKGDELVFVEPDRTLISGDVVQNKVVPNIYGDGGTPSSWIAVLDKIEALNVSHVLPDHSAPGDGTMIAMEKRFITDLRSGALELKKKGVSADDAAKQLAADFKLKYPDWPNMNLAGFTRSIYAE
jgi:glyoxylase-like metal-dependent hydrolase (beta-lactamase superfamily II)